jgi:hypothetical protein
MCERIWAVVVAEKVHKRAVKDEMRGQRIRVGCGSGSISASGRRGRGGGGRSKERLASWEVEARTS